VNVFQTHHTDTIIPNLSKFRTWRLELSFQIGNKEKKDKVGMEKQGSGGNDQVEVGMESLCPFSFDGDIL
jgi:hypothetical protein